MCTKIVQKRPVLLFPIPYPVTGLGGEQQYPRKVDPGEGHLPKKFASALAVGHKTDGDHVLRVIP